MLEQRGYFNGYPVFVDPEFIAGDGLDMVKLDIEHPLEGWVTGPDGLDRLRRAGLVKSSPRESIAAYDLLRKAH